MHELGITQQIVEIACERAQGKKIKRVVVEIGKLSTVLPDAVRFCFEICTEGTQAKGATLEVLEIPGVARCRNCRTEFPLERPFGRCVCGCSDLDWLSGEELRVKEMEVV
ncbi:MAG TPA: hydrogenase maturation nickel metallochaperone HypA [Planctomycetota bacterium]|nr:hydrogenase maturation nickel metallochaperone HypA [Planctomycetota bacterium]